MYIHPNEILELLKKENRPILKSELLQKLGVKSIDELEFIGDQEADEEIDIYIWIQWTNRREKRNEPYCIHPLVLEEFWLNEILYLLNNKNDQIEIDSVITTLEIQMVNYYNLSDPLKEHFNITSDAGLGEQKNKRLLDFIKKHSDIFYIKIGKGKLGLNAWFIGLVEWKDKVLESDRRRIRNAMIKVLRENQMKSLNLKDLTYLVNRIKLDTLISKPFDTELIKALANQNRDRIVFDISNETFALKDDLKYLADFFRDNRVQFDSFNFQEGTSGLLAYIFIGTEVPLQEASEYTKTRPIIFIDEILHRSSPNLIVREELFLYLKSVLEDYDDESIDGWLSRNVLLSYYEEGLDQIQLLFPKVIEHFSPVFNVDRNPGNLFQYTLKSRLENYYKKNPDKKPY